MSVFTRHGFFNVEDGVFKGMGISALLESRAGRDKILSIFGGRENIPTSIMRAEKGKPRIETDEPASNRRYKHTSRGKGAKEKGLPGSAFEMRGMGVRGRTGALSTFPQNIGRSMLLFYSDPGQIVVDPFAGHNSRMDLCVSNGRHYVGYDVSADFMKFNNARAELLRGKYPIAKIELHTQDSRSLCFTKNDSADFTITSPPYYNLEYYGPENEQLGRVKTYEKFLEELGLVLRENFRVLKSGAFCIWFVNDFRAQKKFHAYHMDVANLALLVGFMMHDILIVDYGRGFRDAFVNKTIRSRIIPKKHEYGLVFLKP